MQIDEIIAQVDSLEPNQYEHVTKVSWLSQLDGKIFSEVILTHDCVPERLAARTLLDPDSGAPVYPPYESGSQELIAGAPYGQDMYCYYLGAMIALNNREIAKYSQQMLMFNNAYQEYVNWYNRSRRPRRPGSGNRFRF